MSDGWPNVPVPPALRRWLLCSAAGLDMNGEMPAPLTHWPEAGEELEPSDHGIDGVIQLAKERWQVPVLLTDKQWSEQNRRANALLMGRTDDRA